MGQEQVAPFGTLLKQHRMAAGLTQEYLAERAGLSARAISDLERGMTRRPHAYTVGRLARALDMDERDAARLRTAAERGEAERMGRDPSTLPIPATQLLGREREVQSLSELLGDPTVRLVTLIGTGGVGKTRLVLELAAELQTDYRGGIALVELAPLANPSYIAQVIAQAIGLVGSTQPNTEAALVRALKDADLLLMVDNCEHLIDHCASLIERLLKACPDLRVMATSREPLSIPGEVTFPVPPLTTPPLDRLPAILSGTQRVPAEPSAPARGRDLESFEAVRLFVERVNAARPGFALEDVNAQAVARICSCLDGLPLAIELAAARARTMSLDDLLQRLDNRFLLLSLGTRTAAPRHQTLRATIDWSHDLLTEEERILFRRLTVFAGGWTLADAEFVCADNLLPRQTVVNVHARVVEKSLIVAEARGTGPGWHHLLETIRQYAGERLAETGEADLLRRRHFAHFLDLAERYYHAGRTRGSDPALLALAAHRDNLRAALAWGAEVDPEGSLRLASALEDFWRVFNGAEGWSWLQRTLRVVPQGNPHRLRALLTAGMLAAQIAAYTEGTSLLQEVVATARQTGDRASEAWAKVWLGLLAVLREDIPSAKEYLASALAIHDELGNPLGRVRSLALLGGLQAVILERRAEGEEKLRAAAELAHEIEDSWGGGFAHMMLSVSAADAGDLERTRLHCSAMLHTRGLGPLLGVALQQLGRVSAEDDPIRALRLIGGAAGYLERTSTALPPFVQRRADAARQRAEQLLGVQSAVQTFEEGKRMSVDEAIAFADAEPSALRP